MVKEKIKMVKNPKVTCVTAYTGQGKSTFLRKLAVDTIKDRKKINKVIYFDFETSKDALISKFLSAGMGFDKRIPKGKNPFILECLDYACDSDPISKIKESINYFRSDEFDVTHIFIDCLSLLTSTEGKNTPTHIKKKEIRKLSKELGVNIIYTVQMSRDKFASKAKKCEYTYDPSVMDKQIVLFSGSEGIVNSELTITTYSGPEDKVIKKSIKAVANWGTSWFAATKPLPKFI